MKIVQIVHIMKIVQSIAYTYNKIKIAYTYNSVTQSSSLKDFDMKLNIWIFLLWTNFDILLGPGCYCRHSLEFCLLASASAYAAFIRGEMDKQPFIIPHELTLRF